MLIASVVSYLVSELHRLPGSLVYGLVALLVFGEAALFIGFVLPGETAVLVAGVVASQGRVNIVLLCALVVVAAVIGDTVGFEIGKRYGDRLLALSILKRRRAALDRALLGLERRGATYVFMGRFTAFLRAVMPGLAGASGMRYRRFFLANASGALVWGVSFTLLGYFAGSALAKVEKYASWGATTLLVVIIAVVVTLHFRRRAREARDEQVWLESTTSDDSAPHEE